MFQAPQGKSEQGQEQAEFSLESAEELLSGLLDQVEALRESGDASESEVGAVKQGIEVLLHSIDGLGESRKETVIKDEIHGDMEEDLGKNYESIMNEFIKSLDLDEKVFIQAIVNGSVADMGDAFRGFLTNEGVYEAIVRGGAMGIVNTYNSMARQITRGLGEMVKDPDTGKMVEITKDNIHLGPRHQWRQSFDSVIDSLSDKLNTLEK